MVKLYDLSHLNDSELLMWVKDPINIFIGNIATPSGPIYSNAFSQFVSNPELFLEHIAFTGLWILNGKRIGYVTPQQKFFAQILYDAIMKCNDISKKHIVLMGSPNDNFSTTYQRIWKAEFLRSELARYSRLENGNQCVDEDVDIIKHISSGCFGSVYLAYIGGQSFAMKKTIEKVTATAIKHAYDPKYEAWREINFLMPYLNSLVEKGICPNLPYIYSNLICNRCDFEIDKGGKLIRKKNIPCNTIMMELASGTLKDWYKTPRDDEMQYACLFQCMAGLHAIQKYFQMSNGDIKALNILYKQCPPGGYWEYIIQGKTYYIPNYGDIFIVNDYGVGNAFDSTYPVICKRYTPMGKAADMNMMDIGHRPFIVVNNQFTSINYTGTLPSVSKFINKKSVPPLAIKKNEVVTIEKKPIGAILSDEQKSELEKNGIPTDIKNPMFFSDALLVPYYDIYVDTQDMIRIFAGGERTIQDGTHLELDVSRKLKTQLKPYVHSLRNLKTKTFTFSMLKPSNTIAGYFITEFFEGMFSKPPKGELLQRFII